MTRKTKKIRPSEEHFNLYVSKTVDYDSKFDRVTECAELEF